LPRPSAKRAVAYAVVNAGSNLASIYASYFYPATQGPRYWQANVANVAFSFGCILMATLLRFVLQRRNRSLDKAAISAEGDADPEVVARKWQVSSEYRYTL
jgi:hypothetical protein